MNLSICGCDLGSRNNWMIRLASCIPGENGFEICGRFISPLLQVEAIVSIRTHTHTFSLWMTDLVRASCTIPTLTALPHCIMNFLFSPPSLDICHQDPCSGNLGLALSSETQNRTILDAFQFESSNERRHLLLLHGYLLPVVVL